jgi:hypothetical protein
MIFSVFTTFNDAYRIIIPILQKNFTIKIYIPNTSECINGFKLIKNCEPIIYNSINELNQIFTQCLIQGYSLFLKDNENLTIDNPNAYPLFMKIIDKSSVYIETSLFKKRGKLTEDFFTNVIIESFKNGRPFIGFKLNNSSYIIKGSPSIAPKEIPLLTITNHNPTINNTLNNINSTSTIKVLPLTNWTDPYNFIKHLNRFKPASSNIEFTVTNPDYAMVVNQTVIETNPLKTVYFMMEPYGEKLYESYLSKFNNPTQPLLFKGDHKNHLNLQEYWLNKSVPDLHSNNIQKDESLNCTLSVCVSDRYVDPGHKYRLDLIKKLDEGCGTKYPIQIHIYGKCKSLNFKNYKGECPERDKSNALMSYKYHLNAENHQIDNYITEKFYDALMSENYLFYYGASNASSYFENSFTALTGNIETDINTIVKCIQDDYWTKYIKTIRKVKNASLVSHNVFHRLESILHISKSIFIRINKGTTPVPFDMSKYNQIGWHMVAGCVTTIDTNYEYLKMILEGILKHNSNIILSWKDNYDCYDKFTFKYALFKDKNIDILVLDDPDNVDNIFENTIYMSHKCIQTLYTRLTNNKYNITQKDELLKDLIIV